MADVGIENKGNPNFTKVGPTKPVMGFDDEGNEIVEVPGGKYEYQDKAGIDKMVKEGRLKSSLGRTAKKTIDMQVKRDSQGEDFQDADWKNDGGASLEPGDRITEDMVPYLPEEVMGGKLSASDIDYMQRKLASENRPPQDATEGPDIKKEPLQVEVNSFQNSQQMPSSGGINQDQRVSLTAKNPDLIADTGLLRPLKNTGNGIVFPFTPTINFNHAANYGTYEITHSVYQQNYYINSPNPTISITATFAPQTIEEMAYAVATLNFLKSCTKSDFGAFTSDGQINGQAGLPPPVLILNGYGSLNMQRVPVVIRGVGYTFPEDTDYLMIGFNGERFYEVPTSSDLGEEYQTQFDAGTEIIQDFSQQPGGYISLPAQFLLSIDVLVQQTPTRVRNEFDIRAYRDGSLLTKGFI